MADAFDDEREQTVTLREIVEDIEAQELEADMVLGGDDGKECTYERGGLKRQAIFSCLTCVPGGNAGVCTACTLACHDGHEVVELWTKRNFKCDCGNAKFGGFICKLFPAKDSENSANSYNQNFKGSYCTCGRPYPDPEAEEQVEMIQCCICEDWFHENHLGLDSIEELPRDEEGEPLYDEFICQECSLLCSFLNQYPAFIWVTSKKTNASTSVKEENGSDLGISPCPHPGETENGICVYDKVTDSTSTHPESQLDEKDLLAGETKEKPLGFARSELECQDGILSSRCILGVDINTTPLLQKKRPMFLSSKWRDVLCRCKTCCEFYSRKGIGYLIDKEDSIEAYEKIAKGKREEKLQRDEGDEILELVGSLDHVAKIEVLSGIADMKNELGSFLESVGTSRPITPDDIRGLFENLTRKRQRLQ